MNSESPHHNLQIERRGRFAAIRFDNPPVNALNNGIRAALDQVIDDLMADTTVHGILITTAGRSFVVGADIRELETGVRPPFLGDMLRRIAGSEKPFVAAMRGNVMGGGLEIALACHFRLAATDTRFALPEIKLGLIPGAGGTQRLPRLIGTQEAIEMLLGGGSRDASQALALGLIDQIVQSDVDERGWALLGELGGDVPERELHSVDPAQLAAAEQRVARDPALCALPAARAMIEAVRAAGGPDRDVGFTCERELFLQCRASPEAASMLRAFLAEREARKASAGGR